MCRFAILYVPEARLRGNNDCRDWKLVRPPLDRVTVFTVRSLRAISITGLAMTAIVLAYGSFLSPTYLIDGNEISGWTTILVSLAAFAGMQRVSLGILGEHAGRVCKGVKARPLYAARRNTGQGLDPIRA